MDIFLETDEHRERIESMSSAYLDLDLVDRMLDLGIEWCKEYFQQDWANLSEFSEVPTEYCNGIYAYRMWVYMPDYPWTEAVDILLSPDGSLSLVYIRDGFEDFLQLDREVWDRILSKKLGWASPAYSHITRMAEQWSKEYFGQDQVQIITIYEYPKEYPGYVYGYQIEVALPDRPKKEVIHILVAPDGSMSGVHIA
jgi:hypothetical protein